MTLFVRRGYVFLGIAPALYFPILTGDGRVDFADFLYFADKFGGEAKEEPADLNEDGVIDFADFLLFVSHFGKRSPAIAYNIDLVFFEGFTPYQQSVIEKAARRWEEVIIGDNPRYGL